MARGLIQRTFNGKHRAESAMDMGEIGRNGVLLFKRSKKIQMKY